MTRSYGPGLLAVLLLSPSFAEETTHEWGRSLRETDLSQDYIDGAVDMAYVALVQMSLNSIAVPTEADALRLVSEYARCIDSLATGGSEAWVARSSESGLPLVEVILDASITACVSSSEG
jgi:hypothetical protein